MSLSPINQYTQPVDYCSAPLFDRDEVLEIDSIEILPQELPERIYAKFVAHLQHILLIWREGYPIHPPYSEASNLGRLMRCQGLAEKSQTLWIAEVEIQSFAKQR